MANSASIVTLGVVRKDRPQLRKRPVKFDTTNLVELFGAHRKKKIDEYGQLFAVARDLSLALITERRKRVSHSVSAPLRAIDQFFSTGQMVAIALKGSLDEKEVVQRLVLVNRTTLFLREEVEKVRTFIKYGSEMEKVFNEMMKHLDSIAVNLESLFPGAVPYDSSPAA